MMPQLEQAFGMTAMGVASMVGLFYYGYSPFSLVAGVAMDRLGPRKVVPIGAAMVGIGALLFATGSTGLASAGRLLQGAGGVFALIGAVSYLVAFATVLAGLGEDSIFGFGFFPGVLALVIWSTATSIHRYRAVASSPATPP